MAVATMGALAAWAATVAFQRLAALERLQALRARTVGALSDLVAGRR